MKRTRGWTWLAREGVDPLVGRAELNRALEHCHWHIRSLEA